MEYEIVPKRHGLLDARELFKYRELFFILAWRDIKVKYKQTVLGILWAILQPFAMMIVFSLFLGNAMERTTGDIPYPVFVYSGLMLWGIFATGVGNAGNSLIDQADMVKKIYFPRLIIPVSSLIVALFDFMMTFVVYVLILLYYDFHVNLTAFVFLFPMSIFLTLLASLGIGILFAAANVRFRDFRFVIPFSIQFFFFVTPIIYPASILENDLVRGLMALNPMAGAVNLARGAILSEALDWPIICTSTATAGAIFLYSLYIFRKTEHFCADML